MTQSPPEDRQLNEEQKKAVEFGQGPLMIIAGAGTGKTTVITERIKHLITSGIAKPQEILALTFTEKASREMEDRVDRALPYGVTQMWISTFHAFCDRLLKSEGINVGFDPSFRLMTEAETIMFLRKNIFRLDLTYFRPLGNPTKFVSGLMQHFGRLKDEDITPQQYAAWVSEKFKVKSEKLSEEELEEGNKYKELANAYRTYEELKVKEGVVDYGDLIAGSLKLFRARPGVLARYQEQFKFILIDEFQDTNYAQNELAILLAGSRKNITVVGDDDQAIYRWRGAAVSNMLQFRTTFPDTTVVVLTKNYRSTKEVLDRSYDLIQFNNPDRLEVAEKIDKKLECMRRTHGVPVEVIYADRVEQEADDVGTLIERLVTRDKRPVDAKVMAGKQGSGEQVYQWKDVAILVRANAHAEPFVRALSRRGIPYQFLGPGQLYRQPEVKDLIAYLKVLANFEDNIAMYRVLTMDIYDLAPRDIAALSNYAKKYGTSIFEACEKLAQGVDPRPFVSDTTEKQIKEIVAMIHKHLGLIKKETAGQILYYFLQDSGLLANLTSYANAKEERVAVNISKFFNKIKTYEADHDEASVFAVVEWIELSMSLGESPLAGDSDWTEHDAVNILTIHSAKGLEFPAVFLVNLVSQRFPSMERKEQIPLPDALIKEILPEGDVHLQEERRLFYVGMTRARDILYFTAAKYYGEGKREKKLSPFIAEALGDVYVSKVSMVSDVSTSKQLSFLDWAPTAVKDEPAKVKQPVSYLSYSQLSTFETCPLQYKYRYIVKLPVPPSAALTFGDTMHRVVKSFYDLARAGKSPTKETLLVLLDTHWSSLGYGGKDLEARYKQKGKDLLTGFFEKGYDPTRLPTALEEPFKIRITPKLTLGGRIDRIDTLPDGSIEIIDYKTGQAPKARDVGKDKQLTVYALSAMQEGVYQRPPEKVFVSFYFFEGQEKFTATRSLQEVTAVKEEIAAKAGVISRSDFRPTPGKHCDFCEFRLICEAWT